MDPLSDVLSLVKIENRVSRRFEWGEHWCLDFGRHDGVRVYAVVSGECWLAVEGIRRPLRGTAGDCLILPSGRAFRVGSNLELPAINAETLHLEESRGVLPKRYAGRAFAVLGTHFTLNGEYARILTEHLPPMLHISGERNKQLLRWILDQLSEELREPQVGSGLVVQQLSTLLFVQALRAHLSEATTAGVGWLFALRDPRIRLVLAAMHEAPGHRWTVQSLGERAGMSRTSFAIRFKATVGKSPLEYLTEWRMLLACERFLKSSDSLSMVAGSLGYESDSAFSTAFKRVMHCSPRGYIRANGQVNAHKGS